MEDANLKCVSLRSIPKNNSASSLIHAGTSAAAPQQSSACTPAKCRFPPGSTFSWGSSWTPPLCSPPAYISRGSLLLLLISSSYRFLLRRIHSSLSVRRFNDGDYQSCPGSRLAGWEILLLWRGSSHRFSGEGIYPAIVPYRKILYVFFMSKIKRCWGF